MRCLYILKIDPLCVVSFSNIFSHSVGCLFYGFLWCTTALKFNWVLFVYFCFFFNILGGRSKKILLQFRSKSVLSMFFSRSLIVSRLTFRTFVKLQLSPHQYKKTRETSTSNNMPIKWIT